MMVNKLTIKYCAKHAVEIIYKKICPVNMNCNGLLVCVTLRSGNEIPYYFKGSCLFHSFIDFIDPNMFPK